MAATRRDHARHNPAVPAAVCRMKRMFFARAMMETCPFAAWSARRLRTALLFLTAACLATAGVAAADMTGPVGVIQRFQDTLLSVMKQAQALGYDGRYKKLAPIITATHDLETIARVSVGQYWSKLSDTQRSTLVDALLGSASPPMPRASTASPGRPSRLPPWVGKTVRAPWSRPL